MDRARGVFCVEDGSVDTDDLCKEGISGGKIIVYRQGSNAPIFEMDKLTTTPFIESSENILKEMYELAKSFCQR